MKIRESVVRNVLVNIGIIIAVAISFVTATSESVVNVFSGNDSRLIYRGNPNNANVTLMINVYWGTEYIEEILRIFDNCGVKTTFFIGGTWANKNGDSLKAIADKGHEIGNHGYYHKDHKNLGDQSNRDEILVTERLVESLTGIKTTLFAPPSGSYGKTMLSVCDSLGYRVIMFNKDTIDWRDKDAGLILKRATTKLANGDLILMHPTADTVKALPGIIKSIQDQGFSLVTVSENLR